MARRRHPNRRNSYIGAALGVAALATAGWGVYRWATSASSSAGPGDGPPLGAKKVPPLPRKGSNRPTLSLSLPAGFSLSDGQSEALVQLVAAIAPYYVVTLILPQYSMPSRGKERATATADAVPTSVSLRTILADVPFFDARRILEYSTLSGRQALAKALGCDVHVETSLSPAQTLGHDAEQSELLNSSSSSDSSDEDPSWHAGSDDSPDTESILIIKQGTKLRRQQAYLSSLALGQRIVVLLILPRVGLSALPAQIAHLAPAQSAKEHKRAVKKFARAHAKQVGTLRRTFFPANKTVTLDGKLVLLDCAPEYLRAAARRVENIDSRSATGSDTTSTTSEAWDDDFDPVSTQDAQLKDQRAGWHEAQHGLLHLRARWK